MVGRSTASSAGNGAAARSRGERQPKASKPRTKPDTKRAAAPPAPAAARADVNEPEARAKLVRDSFTMPKPEYSVLAELKLRAARLGRPIKKGELLRAGVAALRLMPDRPFLAALSIVPTLKPGRPKNNTTPEATPPRPRGKKNRKTA
jgi:hypothetical protein